MRTQDVASLASRLMPNAKLKCRCCKEYFRRETMVQTPKGNFCTYDHATKYAIEGIPKAKKQIEKQEKRKFYGNDIKTRREAATREFNRFIRLRDREQPCISCGTTKGVKYDAGHYISAGSCTALRFDERNVSKQCSFYCNHSLSGNRGGYREGILKRYGQECLDYLEGPQPIIKITVDFYRGIEIEYKAKCKELTNYRENG